MMSEKPLIERIDDAVAGYAEGAWVTETNFDKRMVPLLMDASKKLAQLEEQLGLYQHELMVSGDRLGRIRQLKAENTTLKRDVGQAVVELAQKDEWETPMKRLCKIAGIEYPAITTKIEPTSIDTLLAADEPE